MPMPPVPAVTLTPVAYFPQRYFLENLAIRSDGSVLVTALSSKELWWVPPFTGSGPAEPVLADSFAQMPMPSSPQRFDRMTQPSCLGSAPYGAPRLRTFPRKRLVKIFTTRKPLAGRKTPEAQAHRPHIGSPGWRAVCWKSDHPDGG